MTELQMRHAELVEEARANAAREAETHRANVAKEKETNRSNVVNEGLSAQRLQEDERANRAKEGLNIASLEETKRTNQANEDIKYLQAAENYRHNTAVEAETNRANTERERDQRDQTAIKAAAEERAAERQPYEIENIKAATDNQKSQTKLHNAQERDVRWNKLGDTTATTSDFASALRSGDFSGALMNSITDATSYIGKLVSGLTGLSNVFGN